MPSQSLELSFDQYQHRGRRARQQDASFVDWIESPGQVQLGTELLAVVADGMGGHAAGEVASSLVVQACLSVFRAADPADPSRFLRALTSSNQAVLEHVGTDPRCTGMGSTVVLAHVSAEGLRWLSVGDSSLLHFRAGKLRQLNADHSYGTHLDELASRGEITSTQADQDPRRNALMAAINGDPPSLHEIHSDPFPLEPGDWVLLASDGLDTLSHEEIRAILAGRQRAPAIEVATALIDGARSHNSPDQDNVTVIAVRVDGAREHRHVAGRSPSAIPPLLADVLERSADTHVRLSLLAIGAGLALMGLGAIASIVAGSGP